jgi:MerR family transcriptional regulator, redox-sensitive transcriptional activator SoxR
MRIGELAKRARVSASAIRFYESLGLLSPAGRVSGRREYTESAIDALALIGAARRAGFTLREVRALLPELHQGPAGAARLRRAALAKLRELDGEIACLSDARRALVDALDCECGGDAAACRLVQATRELALSDPRPAR